MLNVLFLGKKPVFSHELQLVRRTSGARKRGSRGGILSVLREDIEKEK
jgi:hypothetical protein